MSESLWEARLDQVIAIIKSSNTGTEAAEKCSALLGKYVTSNAVSGALRRLRREKGYQLPTMQEMLGENFQTSVDDGWDLDPGEDDIMVKIPKTKKGPDTMPIIASLDWVPKRILVIPDIHYPNHDPYAVAAMVAYIRDVKPDYIVILGDLLDVSCLSRHDSSHTAQKLSDIKYRLSTEIDAARPLLDECIRITNGNVAWLEGNHEQRRKNVINSNPGLVDLEILEAKNFFDIPDEVWWIEQNVDGSARRLRIGNMFFEHGDKVINSRGSAHIANTMATRRPWCNTFVGHWHCVDRKSKVAYWPDGRDETFITASLGHLSMVKDHSQYAKLPNWTHGFALIETWETDGQCKFSFDQIEMINHEFSRGGKLYSGKKLM